MLAAGFDLQVFFTVVPKPPGQVTAADVLGFITAQRAGTATPTTVAAIVDDAAGAVSARTVRRRLSSVSGLFGYLQLVGMCRRTRCRGGCRPVANARGDRPGHR